MSLERKDVRFKMDPPWHALLVSVATEADRRDIGEWCEALIVAELRRRVQAATVLARATERMGISGNVRELTLGEPKPVGD